MAITSITGLGSGLEINKLVPALVEAEKAPKQAQINNQKARTETQLSAVGMLKEALETFESSLLALKSNSTSFSGYKAGSSKADVASVTMGSGAVAGSYKLDVTQLATASKVASAVQDKSAIYGAGGLGELRVTLGGKDHIIKVSDGATLDEIRDSINSQLSGNGISANIISDSSGSRLVLSSELTGKGNDISVTGSGGVEALSIVGGVQNGTSHVSSGALATDTFKAGELSISLGGVAAAPITMASLLKSGETELTLDQLAERLNETFAVTPGLEQLKVAVTGEGDSRTLSFSSASATGVALEVTGTDDLNITATGTVRSGAGYITKADDAKYNIDGLEMTSFSNTITGLQGLTIKLQEEGTTTLSVSANTDGIVGSVESFVMAYNTLLTVTNGLAKVTATTDKDGNASTQAGALVADSTLRSMMSQMRSALASPVTGAGGLQVLAQLGVSTNRDGSLALDSDKLKKIVAQDPTALAEQRIVALDPAAIQQFFTGDKGLFNRIGDITAVYSGSGGLLASRETSLNSTITGLAEQQASLDRRIENLTLSMFKKFNAMDTLVARLNSTRDSVMATLNALNKRGDD